MRHKTYSPAGLPAGVARARAQPVRPLAGPCRLHRRDLPYQSALAEPMPRTV